VRDDTHGGAGAERAPALQERKERIRKSAKELFSRFGFKKTTVDEIAEDAGISKRTLYGVFGSKEKILADLVMTEALSFRKRLMGQMKAIIDPVEKLRLLCDASRRYFDENPFLGQVLADDAGLYAPFLGNEIHRIEEGMQGIIASILADGIREGVFREMDVPATAWCIMMLYRDFTYQRTPAVDGNTAWVPFILNAIAAKE